MPFQLPSFIIINVAAFGAFNRVELMSFSVGVLLAICCHTPGTVHQKRQQIIRIKTRGHNGERIQNLAY